MMELAEKVKLGYQHHFHGKCEDECPYHSSFSCVNDWAADAMIFVNAYKSGKWIEYTYKDDKTKAVVLTAWRCSNCRHFHDNKDEYCPNCGAQMKF